jgi:hypothetical protein
MIFSISMLWFGAMQEGAAWRGHLVPLAGLTSISLAKNGCSHHQLRIELCPECRWQLPTSRSSDIKANTFAGYGITERVQCRTGGQEIAHPHDEQVRMGGRPAAQPEGGNRCIYIGRSTVGNYRENVEIAVIMEVATRSAPEKPDLDRPHLELAQLNEAAHFVRQLSLLLMSARLMR